MTKSHGDTTSYLPVTRLDTSSSFMSNQQMVSTEISNANGSSDRQSMADSNNAKADADHAEEGDRSNFHR